MAPLRGQRLTWEEFADVSRVEAWSGRSDAAAARPVGVGDAFGGVSAMAGWMIVNMLVSRRAAEVVRSLAALECAITRDPVTLEELRAMTDLTDDQWVLVLTELDVTGYGEFYSVWGIQAVRLTREPVYDSLDW